jgi:flagellar assembly factor FliW
MIIETKFLETIEVNEQQIIKFNFGVPGFEEYKRFVILDIDGSQELKYLQSVDEKNICLLIITPWKHFADYEIELSNDEIKELEITSHEDVLVYNILTVREDKITANLVAPIVINVLKSQAKQIILPNTKYSIRQEIPCLY